MQNRLTPGKLLNKKGNLNEAGYDFTLSKEYNRKDIKASPLKIKEWDYYYFGDEEYGIALTIADNGYMGMVSFSVLDFVNKKSLITKSAIKFFTFGKYHLPSTSETGNIIVRKKKYCFEFYNENGKRHICCFFGGKVPFSCDLNVEETTPNSMVIATPFNKNRHFYYNQKINLLRVTTGSFTFGDLHHEYSNKTLGVLDWGRGVWTYSNTWYWSSLNGYTKDGHRVGFNLGYGFGDTSKASENMLFFDNEAYKLEDVKFNIPTNAKGKDQYLEPWTFTSSNGDINLTFTPMIDRYDNLNILILQSLQHQVFGRFSGTFRVNGKVIEINDVIGFAEKVKNRW